MTKAEKTWKRVRAVNVCVGDELSFFDTKAFAEKRMRVVENDPSFPGVAQLHLTYLRGKVRYRWNMKATDLVRVLRVVE